MGFLNELSKYMVKYGEIVINKAEILAKLAKVKIEIKKRELEIDKVKIEIGDYVIDQFEKNNPISPDVIKFKIDTMNIHKKGIDDMKVTYDNIKAELWGTAAENKEGKQTV